VGASAGDGLVVELQGGLNGLQDVVRDDFFQPPPLDDDEPLNNRGLDHLRAYDDVSLVLLPDLIMPGTIDDTPHFHPPPPKLPRRKVRFVCDPPSLPPPIVPPPPLPSPPALVDNGVWDDLERAEDRLIAHCAEMRDRVAILAPPPSADPRSALRWAQRIATPFAAVYYPWLRFTPPSHIALDDGGVPPARLMPPTGIAAGIIAFSEALHGVGRAPANYQADSATDVGRIVDVATWGRLHAACFNLFRREADIVKLLGARTLSGDLEFRYLHVRRLLTHVERLVEKRMRWVPFEPNNATLWSRIVADVEHNVLLPLFAARAFAGTSPSDSFFVRCDATLNPPSEQELGRLWCEIGIAPNIPAEYIVFRLAATREGSPVLQEGSS
jgi:hypothetical protein